METKQLMSADTARELVSEIKKNEFGVGLEEVIDMIETMAKSGARNAFTFLKQEEVTQVIAEVDKAGYYYSYEPRSRKIDIAW